MDAFVNFWGVFGWIFCVGAIMAISEGINRDKAALCSIGIIALIVGAILYVVSIIYKIKERAIIKERLKESQEERIRQEQKEREERQREKEERDRRILASPVRNLDPLQFEVFTALYIKNRGYYQIDLTPVSGDFGADIIAYNPQGKRSVFNVKNIVVL